MATNSDFDKNSNSSSSGTYSRYSSNYRRASQKSGQSGSYRQKNAVHAQTGETYEEDAGQYRSRNTAWQGSRQTLYDNSVLTENETNDYYSRSGGRYRAQQPRARYGYQRKAKKPWYLIFVACLVLVLCGGIYLFVQNLPITITLNGEEVTLSGDKSLAGAMEASGVKPTPGDLVAVDGSVINTGEGEDFYASVNDEKTTDTTLRLHAGDVVVYGDGEDIEEEYSSEEQDVEPTVSEEGTGPIHIITGDGSTGTKVVKTGLTSGISVEEITDEPGDLVKVSSTVNTGGDKVIALTFDDGPWWTYTEEILDILKKYNAKATFFTIGNQIADLSSVVERELAEGHQVCTHTWDHAEGSGQGVNLGYMTKEEQIEEIQKGYEAIEAVSGTTASHIIRTPGGNFGEAVWTNLYPYIDAEIGWSIDTMDWSRPGVSSIVEQIESATAGSIVLMHDGGGDRSETVEALKTALPYLIEKGYSFVTIDELLKYNNS